MRKPIIFARVDAPFRERVHEGAETHFQGNESMLVRDAVELYLDLRETHGPRFDLVVLEMRNKKEPVAA